MNANELFSTLHISCLQGNLNDIKKNIVKEWINPNIKSQVSNIIIINNKEFLNI